MILCRRTMLRLHFARRKLRHFPWVLLIIFLATEITLAQGRVITAEITSPSLVGNAIGDPATRNSRIYLPPSYESSTRRYPVVYYLHGGGRDENSLIDEWSADRTVDRLIDRGTMNEAILVTADATTSYAGSNYMNSDLLGHAEDYIVQDVVSYIDANFRTIADRDSRGLVGASSGGNGALRYAMLHSDVFGAVSALSSGMYDFSHPDSLLYLEGDRAAFSQRFLDAAGESDPGAALAGVVDRNDVSAPALVRLVYNWAGSLSPNLDSPILSDLPFEVPDLEIVPEIRDRWYEFDLYQLLPQHVEDLSSLRGFSMDVGNQDSLTLLGNQSFHQALLDAGVDHTFEIYTGGHSNRRAQRIEEALTFQSNALVVSSLDFGKDGTVDVTDMNLLCSEVASAGTGSFFDLDRNMIIDSQDVAYFLNEHRTHPGDANLNGEIAFDDFLTLSANFGQSPSSLWSGGDFDCNGEVDFADFLLLSGNFGRTAAARPASVPEPRPSTLILSGALLILVALRRYRRNRSCSARLITAPSVVLSTAATIAILTTHSVQVAHAGIVERDWKNPGDGLLTFDDSNNREWLDLTETQGMSIADVTSKLGPIGDYAGFVHASANDVLGLATSAGVQIDLRPWALDPVPAVRELQQLVGITDDGSWLSVWSVGIALAETNSDTKFAEVQFFWTPSDPPEATLSLSSWNVDPGRPLFDHGMWLLRPVCDPNTEGDINRDGIVNFNDFLTLSANFNMAATSHIQGDIDCNGTVEFDDFLVLAKNFNKAVGAQTSLAVPEPSGLDILGLVGLLAGGVQRRRRNWP